MTQNDIEKASAHVAKGGLVVFPTDTVFGIGCDPFNADAITKLYAVKNRAAEKSIPVLVSSIEKAQEIATIFPIALQLIEKHWPGALTIVVPQRTSFPEAIANDNSIAIRLPNHPLARELIDACGGALATTSANISGESPAATYEEAVEIFANNPDVYILEGEAFNEPPSTIADCRPDAPKVLRQGTIRL